MKLYLEKRGCNFSEKDENACRESDLGNYRLFLEFIAKDGRRICGDITRGDVRKPITNNRGRTDYKTVSTNGLYAHLQYENHTGCYAYVIDVDFTPYFTQADALKLVNAASAVQYDAVEIVDRLPPAAHEYPESALALERAYKAADHAALYAETEQKVRDNYMHWTRGLEWSFKSLTADEYKRLTLLAFELAAKQYGKIDREPENKLTPGALVAHHMAKHFFEEQHILDPYTDDLFLSRLEALSPYYVGRYLSTVTPEEFAAAVQD